MYSFKGKFALVTGGAQGLGLAYIKELLLHGIEGVTLVDCNNSLGKISADALNKDYDGKVIFVEADVTKADEFEDAFESSINHWKYLDIVINNAGVLDEEEWVKDISVNCEGTVRGVTLGFKYMNKTTKGRGGIILNVSSMVGLDPHYALPIYSATKSFVIGLGRGLGVPIYFDNTGVKVLTICPGPTHTAIMNGIVANSPVSICPNVKSQASIDIKLLPIQRVESVAKAMVSIIQNGSNGSVWVIENNEPLYEVIHSKRYNLKIPTVPNDIK